MPLSDSEEDNFSEDEIVAAAVFVALAREMETQGQLDVQQTKDLHDGHISRYIKQLKEGVNSVSALLESLPEENQNVINREKLKEFNELVNSYFALKDLLKEIFSPEFGAISRVRALEYEQQFVPKYEKVMNQLCLDETGKDWAFHQHSDFYLRRYLLNRIEALSYKLQAQKKIALSSTFSPDVLQQVMILLRKEQRVENEFE